MSSFLNEVASYYQLRPVGALPNLPLRGHSPSCVQCEAAGISVIRSTVGTFMPALDMNGMSITLLKASGPGADVMLQRYSLSMHLLPGTT